MTGLLEELFPRKGEKMAVPIEFEKWWTAVKDLSEFAGVTEAAALNLWLVAGGKKPLEEKEEKSALPEPFRHFWANAQTLAEFRGCTMPAAYAAWLDGQRNSDTDTAMSEKIKQATRRLSKKELVEVKAPVIEEA